MEKRKLGTSDIMVSKICLGTMNMGTCNTESEGHWQIDTALDYGVNFLDTAEMYPVPTTEEKAGLTETIIGNWLEKSGRRSDVILATKVSGPSKMMPEQRPHLGTHNRLDRANIVEALDTSLKRLKTDYIDLYQLHWPERPTNFFGQLRYKHVEEDTSIALEETLTVLQDLVKEGKVRHVGLSNETAWGMQECLRLHKHKGLPRMQSVQNPYNLLNRSYEVDRAELSIRETMGLLAYSPIAFGALSGKFLNGARPEGARLTLHGERFPRYTSAHAETFIQKYVDLAQENDLDPCTLALAFVTQQPFLTSNIIGARTNDQLILALESANVTLSKDIVKAITDIDNLSPFPCP